MRSAVRRLQVPAPQQARLATDVQRDGRGHTPRQPSQARTRRAKQPTWDPIRRELRTGNLVLKKFLQPAADQELILASFQELGWPERIDDPLPPKPGMNPKQRLHHALKNLNRGHWYRLLHFGGDGTGRGVCWEWLRPSDPRATPERP